MTGIVLTNLLSPHLIPTAIELGTITSPIVQLRKLSYRKFEFQRQNLDLPVAQVNVLHTED